ncbi:EF-hand domain-containing protein [Azonexus fungiphilus]|uniref:EF-hand domain-containing protein n=1 Tax=Azonexus fungiphilus TaxID=146940 RepID=UPI00156B21AA|nr:EF-hand domain-containing protein [Azonexus fungiphilus]NHC06192.1 EF-hand domain-containing protein [Azonexus fungiphilus]
MISGLGSSSQMSQLFSRLDSKSQGYLEKSDLASAFGAISGGDDSAVDEVFAAFDTDSDGKVTESEFASTLSKLQEELDAQFGQMRMQGGMPPPPPAGDEGFTQEELAAQLEEIGDTDSDRASLIADVVANFEAADSDGDGKVSFREARAYDESQQSSASAASAGTQAASSESQVMMKIMQLMQAYGQADERTSSLLSTLA